MLGDEEKRKQYDQVREMAAVRVRGRAPRRAPAAAGPGRGRRLPGGVRFEDLGDLGDLFGGLFGGGGPRARRASEPQRGADLETEVTLSFDDAMPGTTVPVRITGPAVVPDVSRDRRGAGHEPETCARCAAERARWP